MNSLIIVEIVDLNTFVVFLQFYTVSYFIFSYNNYHPGFLPLYLMVFLTHGKFGDIC